MQQCINRAVFERLDYIVLYPVEDENKFTDRKGVILPDAFLMKRSSRTSDLAFRVYSKLEKAPSSPSVRSFIYIFYNHDNLFKVRLHNKENI